MSAKDKLIVALDVDTIDDARELVDQLKDDVGWFKVGSHLFTKAGPRVCDMVRAAGVKVFLDLKFHDIPNTVYGAVSSAATLGVNMLTLHTCGGEEMMRRAMDAVEDSGVTELTVVGVTVLTSMSSKELATIYETSRTAPEQVVALAALAKKAGLPGVVASAQELSLIKEAMGADFKVVTPGIRLPDAKGDDQKRVVTPEAAVADGADYIVVGRPIIHAKDPAHAAREIVARIENAA